MPAEELAEEPRTRRQRGGFAILSGRGSNRDAVAEFLLEELAGLTDPAMSFSAREI